MVAGPIGCGVIEHHEKCLCDVVLPQTPTPIRVKDAVKEMFMGPQICELRGYGVPWTPSQMLDYFTDLCRFYDSWTMQNDEAGFTLNDVPRGLHLEGRKFEQWAIIRETVKMCMDRLDLPLVHILQHLDVAPDQFLEAACAGQATTSMTFEQLAELDEKFTQKSVNMSEVARETGLSKGNVRSLLRYWKRRRGKLPPEQMAKERMHDLALNTDLLPHEICRIVLEEFGRKYHSSSVTKYRQRFTQ